MHRAESAPAICFPASGNGDKAVTGAPTDGSLHRFAEAGSQNVRKAPLTMMLEGQQAPSQLIPVRPRCYHPDPRRSVHVNQSRRLLLGPERMLAQLSDFLCAATAEHCVFQLAADTVDGNQHSEKVDKRRLQACDDSACPSLVRATTSRPNMLRRFKVGVEVSTDLPCTDPWAEEGRGITDGKDHPSSLTVRLFLRKADLALCG